MAFLNELPTNRYFLDGMDMWTTWGIVPYDGSDDLMKFPKRKPSITHDWGTENGIDVDLELPFFESKTVNLRCSIVCPDEATFWKNYNSFWAQLAQPGMRRLEIKELSQSFYVFYEECTEFTRFTRLKEGVIGCKFALILHQQLPTMNTDDRYIVDDDGRHIVT